MPHTATAPGKAVETNGVFRWLMIGFVILAGLALAAIANRLPGAAPKSVAPTAFSAERAMDDVRAIAVRPHPIGSREIEDTRTYLMSRLQGLGLDPQIRDQNVIATNRHFSDLAVVARVRNIVGELKGSNPALPAVLLMAHYDTVAHSPGAGDDTSGVAVALEVARALKASGKLQRSVILLFTDGEEAGLLGSTAFFDEDPLRNRVGLVVNMEARGDSGRALMFQTSPNNRGLIEVFGRHAKSPSADSLSTTLYEQMPNDTDLTAALAKGYQGLNFAFVGHQTAYHTRISTPDKLNAGSLQHMGDQVLPVVLSFAQSAALPKSDSSLVYSDMFGQAFLSYPMWVGWLLAIAALGIAAATLVLGMASGRISGDDAARGAGGLLALLLGIATSLWLLARLAAFLLSGFASPYALIGQFDGLLAASAVLGMGAGLLLIHAAARGKGRTAALAAIAAGVIGAVLGTFDPIALGLGVVTALVAWLSFRRQPTMAGFLTGAILLLAVLAVVLQSLLPGGAHVLVWPALLIAGIAAGFTLAPQRATRPAGLVLITVAAVLVAGLMAVQGYTFFLMMGAMLPVIVTPFIAIGVLALAPLLWASRGTPWAGAAGLVAGLAVCAVIGMQGGKPSAKSPEMVEAFHLTDIDKQASYWIGGKLDPTGWVKSAIEQDGGKAERKLIEPLFRKELWVAQAKTTAFARPALTLAITGAGADRRVSLSAANANGGRTLRIFLKPSAELAGMRILGKPIEGKLPAGKWSYVTVHATGAAPIDLTVPMSGQRGRLDVELVEIRDGWPAGAKNLPRPENVLPIGRSDTSVIQARAAIGW